MKNAKNKAVAATLCISILPGSCEAVYGEEAAQDNVILSDEQGNSDVQRESNTLERQSDAINIEEIQNVEYNLLQNTDSAAGTQSQGNAEEMQNDSDSSENILTSDVQVMFYARSANGSITGETTGQGVSYYISADGRMNGRGTKSSPISILKLSDLNLFPGDRVCFRNGDKFNTNISYKNITMDPNVRERVTFTNYIDPANPKNELPTFSAYKIANEHTWTREEGTNYWYADFADQNTDCSGYGHGNGHPDNADQDDNNIGFIYNPDTEEIYGKKVYSKEDLRNNYDFYYQNTGNSQEGRRLYVYCTHNPNSTSEYLYLADRHDLFNVSSNTNIENLRFEICGGHAVSNNVDVFLSENPIFRPAEIQSLDSWTVNHVTVQNCEIDKIGGCQSGNYRVGNGIEFMKTGNDIDIKDNVISNCYDTATTLQGINGNWDHVKIHNNTFVNNSESFEIWLSDYDHQNHHMTDVEFYNNTCINQGRGWGSQYRSEDYWYKAADFEMQQMHPTPDADGEVRNNESIKIYNNDFFNPIRFMYLDFSQEKFRNQFKDNISIKNNRIYLQEDGKVIYRIQDGNLNSTTWGRLPEEPYGVNQLEEFFDEYSRRNENGAEESIKKNKDGNYVFSIRDGYDPLKNPQTQEYDNNTRIEFFDNSLTSMGLFSPVKPDFRSVSSEIKNKIKLKKFYYPEEWNNNGIKSLIDSIHIPFDNECAEHISYTNDSNENVLTAENEDSSDNVTYKWFRNTTEDLQTAVEVENAESNGSISQISAEVSSSEPAYYYCIAIKEISDENSIYNNMVEAKLIKAVKCTVETNGSGASNGDNQEGSNSEGNTGTNGGGASNGNNQEGSNSGENTGNSSNVTQSSGSSSGGSGGGSGSGGGGGSTSSSSTAQKSSLIKVNNSNVVLKNNDENSALSHLIVQTVDKKNINFTDFSSFEQNGIKGTIAKSIENNNNYLYVNVENTTDTKNNNITLNTAALSSSIYVYTIDQLTKEPVLINTLNNTGAVNIKLDNSEQYVISDNKVNAFANNAWNNKDNNWMYVKDGKVATGWVDHNGSRYYCNKDGKMTIGWQKIDNSWYYFNTKEDGKMGAMKTGWIKDNLRWYYLNNDGKMKTGWLKDSNGAWYYLKNSGDMATGWLKDSNGKWYYLSNDGSMAYNVTVNGYKLGNDGAWIK